MVMLALQGVSKSFVVDCVIRDVNLTVRVGQRLGLVGTNGSGKSTLFKIIMGQEQPDEGSVTMLKGAKAEMLTQHADIDSTASVYEELEKVFEPLQQMESRLRQMEAAMSDPALSEAEIMALADDYAQLTERFEEAGGYEWPSRIAGALTGLGLPKDRWDMPANLLSGGEKTRLCLARILLKQPDLLLLDEPTNHLDLNAVQWLEDTLKKYPNTVMVISHDRYFLNAVCDGIAELSMTRLNQYEGNYDAYSSQRAERLERQLKEYNLQQTEIARQKAIIARYRGYATEAALIKAKAREKMLARIELVDKPTEEHTVRFRFRSERKTGNDVLMVQDLSKSFGERTLFSNFKLHLRAGDRVAIIGPNGVGKSTLLKILVGELEADTGTVRYGSNIDLGYFDQQQSGLDPQKQAMDEVWDDFPRMEPDQVRNALALFLFTGDDVFKQVKSLSGGERARIVLTKLMLKNRNVLILDEPTNHLDMDSREVLEMALADFEGTLLMVSHDRYFINQIANRVIEMRADGTTEYLGNYDDYLEKKNRMEAREEELVSGPTRTQIEKDKRREREARQQQKEAEALLLQAEQRIVDAEAELEKLNAQMADPATYDDADLVQQLSLRHHALQQQIEELYEQWQALSSQNA